MAGLTSYVTAQVAFGVLIGAVLLVVARVSAARHASSQYPTASRMFALWWGGLGVAWWVWAADTTLVNAGASGSGAVALDYVLVAAYFALVFAAFACLFYYLVFLFVGSPRLSWAVWLVYGALVVAFVGLFAVSNPPSSAHVTGLYGDAIFGAYQNVASVLGVVFLVPVVLAALSLFFVAGRVHDPGQRYRLLLLGASLTFYLLMPLVFPSNPGIQPKDGAGWAREVLNKVGLLVAVAAALLSSRPPAWFLRARPEAGERRVAERSALEQRVRDLI